MKKYQVIIHALSEIIDAAQPGDRLPSERDLARTFNVSAMTVRRALQFLTDGGRIHSVRGRGTFVSQPRVLKSMTNQSFSSAMRAQGRVPSAKLLSADIAPATSAEQKQFKLTPGSKVIHINRIRLGDDIPLCIEHAAFSAGRFPELLGSDLTGSLYDVLSAKYETRISRASFRVRARRPSQEEADMLRIAPSTACLEIRNLGKDQGGSFVELTTSLYRGDLYELGVDFE